MKKYVEAKFWDGKTRICEITPQTDIYIGTLSLLAHIARTEGVQLDMIDVKESRVFFSDEEPKQ